MLMISSATLSHSTATRSSWVGITLHPPFSHMHWLSENQSLMQHTHPLPDQRRHHRGNQLTDWDSNRPADDCAPRRACCTSKCGYTSNTTQWHPMDLARSNCVSLSQ